MQATLPVLMRQQRGLRQARQTMHDLSSAQSPNTVCCWQCHATTWHACESARHLLARSMHALHANTCCVKAISSPWGATHSCCVLQGSCSTATTDTLSQLREVCCWPLMQHKPTFCNAAWVQVPTAATRPTGNMRVPMPSSPYHCRALPVMQVQHVRLASSHHHELKRCPAEKHEALHVVRLQDIQGEGHTPNMVGGGCRRHTQSHTGRGTCANDGRWECWLSDVGVRRPCAHVSSHTAGCA
jgi:hypothetical protein